VLVGLANWLMAISLIFLCKGVINSLTPRRSIGGAFRGGSSGPIGSLPDIAILEALGICRTMGVTTYLTGKLCFWS
jgi:hypothetical protein